MNRASNTNIRGFTLIELMLSMAFISVLLVAIMMTIMQITRIYDKGISMREVNQAGRSITDDLYRTIASATPFDINDTNRYRPMGPNGSSGGRLCTGQVSYIWNIGNSTANGSNVRFVKVRDPDAVYCSTGASVTSDPSAVDLLRSGDRDLVIHNFTIDKFGSANDDATGQALYAVRFIVGVKDSALLESNSASCRPPDTAAGGENYCAVNRFELVVRAGNRELLNGD